MEPELCVSEELGRKPGHPDGGILQIEYKDIDPYKDVTSLCALLWEYWLKVNQEDLSEWEDVEIKPGIIAPYQKVEMMAYTLATHGAKFRGAFLDGRMVSFMCYRVAYDVVLLIDHFFVLPEYEGRGIGKAIVNSLPNGVKRVYFWTRKANPPKLLQAISNAEPLYEDDKHITWEMKWVDHRKSIKA